VGELAADDDRAAAPTVQHGPDARAAPAQPGLPDRPSVAVLPFQNLSGDPEQEYFADGMVEDIITALSRMRRLFVIARNSSFTYKGRAVDVKQVGRELGVRYIVEGGVRKAANRVRISAQLIDAATGIHIWADRFDGGIEDIFDLQDRMTERIVGAIAPTLQQAEIERAKRKPTENLDAYDFFLRGMASFYARNRGATDEALRLFSRSFQIDPDLAAAYGLAAWCYAWRKMNGWMTDRPAENAEGARLARRAVELGGEDAVALARGGHALAYLLGDVETAIAFLDRALALNPNLATAWYLSGWVRMYGGEPDVAIEHQTRAMRLSPLDPDLNRMQIGIGFAHYIAGRYEDAASWAAKASRSEPAYSRLAVAACSAASNAMAGRMAEARRAMETVRAVDPALRVADLAEWTPLRRPEHATKWAEGLRRAGLPE
jgi:TolB-like protein